MSLNIICMICERPSSQQKSYRLKMACLTVTSITTPYIEHSCVTIIILYDMYIRSRMHVNDNLLYRVVNKWWLVDFVCSCSR